MVCHSIVFARSHICLSRTLTSPFAPFCRIPSPHSSSPTIVHRRTCTFLNTAPLLLHLHSILHTPREHFHIMVPTLRIPDCCIVDMIFCILRLNSSTRCLSHFLLSCISYKGAVQLCSSLLSLLNTQSQLPQLPVHFPIKYLSFHCKTSQTINMTHTKHNGSSSKSGKSSKHSNSTKKGPKKNSSSAPGSAHEHQEIHNMERLCDSLAQDIKETNSRVDKLIERVAMKTFHDIVSNQRPY